jgi:hypothetical protein
MNLHCWFEKNKLQRTKGSNIFFVSVDFVTRSTLGKRRMKDLAAIEEDFSIVNVRSKEKKFSGTSLVVSCWMHRYLKCDSDAVNIIYS